jgi:5-methyltetrahydropteroyltriglutamate--homocysteine methyltransferase
MSPSSAGLYTASAGSYPRIGDTHELQLLRRTIAALDRGERTTADFLDAENQVTRWAIGDQVKSGLDVITDGLIRWNDPISHLAGKMENVRSGGLLRYFDTNFYFRQPILSGKPARRCPLVVNDYNFARNALGLLPTPREKAGKLMIKPVLTGPYTLAKFSLAAASGNGSPAAFSSLESRAQAYAEALAGEIEALAEAGAEMIQIDEPAAIKFPADWPIFEAALARLAAARDEFAKEYSRSVELALYTYFHDATPLYEKLVELPVEIIGLDFTYNKELADLVAAVGSPKPLALGFIDARNTALTDADVVCWQVERLLPKISGGRAYLGPSAGLEYLPRDRAYAKLEHLAQVRALLQGGASTGAAQ